MNTDAGTVIGIPFIINSLLLGAGLAMDAFSVSIANGLEEPSMRKRRICAIAGVYALFQFSMPLIGWLFGESLLGPLGKAAPFIAFGILAFIGGKMLIESFKKEESEQTEHLDITKWKNVILLAVATSIDALAVGFSFAMIHEEHVTRAFLTIGITSFVVSFLAYTFVRKFTNPKIGRYAETVGGIVLILIGVKILLG